jgi:hypothetical protein
MVIIVNSSRFQSGRPVFLTEAEFCCEMLYLDFSYFCDRNIIETGIIVFD